MATASTNQRASRRTAASAARKGAAAPEQQAVVPEVEEIDTAADEAFGMDEVAAPASAASAQLSPAVKSASSRTVALPMEQEDLARKIDASDLIMPKLKLIQGLSAVNKEFARTRGASGVPEGNWYHTNSATNLGETVYFVPVDMRKSRGYFVQGQGLMCRSFDMLNGEGTPGISCEGSFEERHEVPADQRGCALRLWKKDESSGVNRPPECGMSYNFPGLIIVDIDEPAKSKILQAMLTLRSTGTAAAKAINTAVMEHGEGVWHNVVIELSSTEKNNSRGTFFTATADFFDSTEAPDFARVRRQAESFARSMNPARIRATIEADAD